LTCAGSLYKCTVQNTGTGGRGEKVIPNAVRQYGLYLQQSVATREFQCIFHTCVEKMEFVWTTGSYANELGFHTMYCMMQ
jgi:hypothetical protein